MDSSVNTVVRKNEVYKVGGGAQVSCVSLELRMSAGVHVVNVRTLGSTAPARPVSGTKSTEFLPAPGVALACMGSAAGLPMSSFHQLIAIRYDLVERQPPT